MLQNSTPKDYVIATGISYSVRYFCAMAFNLIGIKIEWQGVGIDEKGVDLETGKILVEVDPTQYRPSEVEELVGDPKSAMQDLGWNPKQTSIEELIRIMVESDLKSLA
jgi:GDPmannose 4,6-dehydratase